MPVIALRPEAFRPTLERPHVDPEKLCSRLLRQFLRLRPIQQTRKSHPSYTLVNGCRAHRAPFVPGTKNTTLHELQTHDRSRATDKSASVGCQVNFETLLSQRGNHVSARNG